MAKGKELIATISLKGKVDKSVNSAFDKITGMAKGFSGAALKIAGAGFTAAGAAAVAASKQMFDLGSSFQEASNTIRIGTGATGEALEALNSSFDNVYKSVPTTMETASQAIADFNTRLGLTGDPLESLSKQAIQVSNLLGDDIGSVIEESSQAFQQWGISANDMGAQMDYIFKLSQSTGVGFTQLMSATQQYGAQMQELGFSFEETSALLGQLDKAGVNSGEVMGALKKSVTAFAKEGLSASEGLETYINRIQEAGTAAEATAIASEVFGARAGSTMSAAIRDGSLSVGELVAELQAADETILKAAEDTETFPQKLQRLKASAQVALKPVANGFLDIAMDAIPAIESGINTVIPVISDGMARLAPVMENISGTLIPAISTGISTLAPVILGVIPAAEEAFNSIAPLASRAFNNLMSITGETFSGIIGMFAGRTITNVLTRISPYLSNIINTIAPALAAAGETVGSVLTTISDTINTYVLPGLDTLINTGLTAGESILSALTPIIDRVSAFYSECLPIIGPFFEKIIEDAGILFQNYLIPIGEWLINNLAGDVLMVISLVGAKVDTVLSIVEPILPGIIQTFGGVIDFITGVFTGDWQMAWEGVKGIFEGIWNSLTGIVKGVITGIVKGINHVINGINTMISTVGADKVAEFLGFSGKIATIPLPQFAAGATVTSPTLAMVGDGGEPETIIPHNNSARSRELLNEAARGVLGAGASVTAGNTDNSRTYNITFSPIIQGAGLTDKDLQDSFEKFKRMMTQYMAEQDREVFA